MARTRTYPSLIAACLLAAILIHPADAARRGEDPDWPCQQRLVPTLSAATFWNGPPPAEAGDWRAEPRVSELVERIVPRRVSAEEGEAAITAFASKLTEDRPRLLALVFAGLLEETNSQRQDLIGRIKNIGHRQRNLAELASRTLDELQAIPADATGEAADRRKDLEQRQMYVTRAFEEAQRTIRYACEAPVQLEARLGVYARALQRFLS